MILGIRVLCGAEWQVLCGAEWPCIFVVGRPWAIFAVGFVFARGHRNCPPSGTMVPFPFAFGSSGGAPLLPSFLGTPIALRFWSLFFSNRTSPCVGTVAGEKWFGGGTPSRVTLPIRPKVEETAPTPHKAQLRPTPYRGGARSICVVQTGDRFLFLFLFSGVQLQTGTLMTND